MNTKTIAQFETLNPEMLASVEGGMVILLPGGGGALAVGGIYQSHPSTKLGGSRGK